MDNKFIKPDFKIKDIELRFTNSEVCIYATEAGLKKIIDFCKILLDKPEKGHIHIDDYDILTENSLKGVIAILKKE